MKAQLTGYRTLLEERPVSASAPCRIDFGGTVDLPAFHYALKGQRPGTVNMALDLRTRVTLTPHEKGKLRIESRGFKPAGFDAEKAPLAGHPLGLLFAVCRYFSASGVNVSVVSESPVRSALGGSSVAAVALTAAFSALEERRGGPRFTRRQAALLAQMLESGTAGVVCGLQDQLAAAFGGVHLWRFPARPEGLDFTREVLIPVEDYSWLEERVLVAFCGAHHDSLDVNGEWVAGFLSGRTRGVWKKIMEKTGQFATALKKRDTGGAMEAMREELELRIALTPGVLDKAMDRFIRVAAEHGAAARFSGAGGGGCAWAMGEPEAIEKTRKHWQSLAVEIRGAKLLPLKLAALGAEADGKALS